MSCSNSNSESLDHVLFQTDAEQESILGKSTAKTKEKCDNSLSKKHVCKIKNRVKRMVDFINKDSPSQTKIVNLYREASIESLSKTIGNQDTDDAGARSSKKNEKPVRTTSFAYRSPWLVSSSEDDVTKESLPASPNTPTVKSASLSVRYVERNQEL